MRFRWPVCFAFAAALSAQTLREIPAASKEVADEATGIKIRIASAPYLLSATEVTQAEYEAITGRNPSIAKGANRPVENVTWWDAIRYCNLRSLKENLQPVYDLATGKADRARNGYRLPSDAEWEAAADPKPAEDAHLGIASTKDRADLVRLINEKGTRPVASGKPTSRGVYDIHGNVWEWTDDFWNPSPNSPQSNGHGVARILRGGSFISTTSRWARSYRSSMKPEHRSRFTGFRVARTLGAPPTAPAQDTAWYQTYWQPPAGFEQGTGALTPLVKPGITRAEWPSQRAVMQKKWQGIVGTPDLKPHTPRTRKLDTFSEALYRGELLELQTEPDSWEKILILTPHQLGDKPAPVVIVPYYDVDTPGGRNLGGRSFMTGGVRAYAQLAAQRGMIAVAIRWFGESYGEWYEEAVANLALRHPKVTGLGKWVWDAQRLVDYLETVPSVDSKRIGIIGHSLGAKMATYAAALDDRIGAVVASEGGVGFSMSNYDDYWYLGRTLSQLEPGTDQHELLGLIAPRPFLLIGGDEYDGPKSWHYIHAAKAVYELHGKPQQIGYFNHHKGHSPTPEAIAHAFSWLETFLR